MMDSLVLLALQEIIGNQGQVLVGPLASQIVASKGEYDSFDHCPSSSFRMQAGKVSFSKHSPAILENTAFQTW